MQEIYKATEKGNVDKIEAEIENAQKQLLEAKKRQEEYDQKRKENERARIYEKESLEELKKNKLALKNFFNNEEAVKSTVEVLDTCIDYYFNLIFLDNFMKSLSVFEVTREFHFISPFDLMSYSKLRTGLMDTLVLLESRGIECIEFENIARKFIALSLFKEERKSPKSKELKALQEECSKIITGLRTELCDIFKIKNRQDIVRKVVDSEKDFMKALNEVGW